MKQAWTRAASLPSRRDVVNVGGETSDPLPFYVLRRRAEREKEEQEAREAAAAAKLKADLAASRPVALGVAPEEVAPDLSALLVMPAAQVTTSVGGATNVTFDLHLMEDFKHLFDDISLGSLANNTNLVVLKIAAPVVAALALEPLISLVDTYYVGHYLGAL